MAQKDVVARAGRGLLDVLKLLLRGIGTLCAAVVSFVLFAWKHNEDEVPSDEFGSEHAKVVRRELSEGRY